MESHFSCKISNIDQIVLSDFVFSDSVISFYKTKLITFKAINKNVPNNTTFSVTYKDPYKRAETSFKTKFFDFFKPSLGDKNGSKIFVKPFKKLVLSLNTLQKLAGNLGNDSTDIKVKMKQLDSPISQRHYCGCSRQLSLSSFLMIAVRQPRDQQKFLTTKHHS